MVHDGLLSILCADTWILDSMGAFQITFHTDGTGEVTCRGLLLPAEMRLTETQLVCRAELLVWIAAEFDWKPTSAESPKTSDATHDGFDKPNPVDQADIELTLTKRRIPGDAGFERYRINEALLTDDAFLPKTYLISLERGVFLAPFDAQATDNHHPYTARFAYRLSFDKSPYPPREEWREPEGAPDAIRFWEWKQFCGGQIGSF
ncbi:Uncharacterized protein TCAP_05076 [Tolypocladium capitatum]|uniref:Uncharacterized protein n=1 Tax=Tolypocladium capitatum TaxID=45235 RepID=A0A2K3QBT0_9HYPO|nr:Uncharacterized protein TCAP_05076 [Tolypocladium capitatum]